MPGQRDLGKPITSSEARCQRDLGQPDVVIIGEDNVMPPSKKPKGTAKKTIDQDVAACGETANILTGKTEKFYAQIGKEFFCQLDKQCQDNTYSGTCEFSTMYPKEMAEHISYQHREDSLIY